jgi:hypothetical protein
MSFENIISVSNLSKKSEGFEVLTAVAMKSTVFWVVMLGISKDHIASIFRVEE